MDHRGARLLRVDNRRSRVLIASALLLGAGSASGVTALATYFTRYSRVDALFGEIDGTLYAQVTQMAPAEKAVIVVAALLLADSPVGLLSLLRHPRLRS